MKKLALHWKILLAMILGVLWAIISGKFGWNEFTADWIDPFGTIFINGLKLIAVPLVLFSIITGVAGMGNPAKLGRIGAKTLLMYLLTTVMSISVGLVLVNIWKPGVQSDQKTRLNNRLQYELWANQKGIEIKDGKNLLLGADSTQINIAASSLSKAKDDEAYKQAISKLAKADKAKTGDGPLQPLIDIVPSNIVVALGDGRLMLQVIFFAILFGITMAILPKAKTTTVLEFFIGMNEIFIKMVHIIMKGAPFFVFCLMAGVLAKSANSLEELTSIFLKLMEYSVFVNICFALLLF